MSNQIHELRRMIYNLKNAFGLKITYFKNNGSTINYQTGVASQSTTQVVINRAIRLPTKGIRNLFAAMVKSTLGDYLEIDRQFIIDRKDITFRPAIDDWVELHNDRYTIKEVHELDGNNGFLIVTSSINVPPISPHIISDSVSVEQAVIAEVN